MQIKHTKFRLPSPLASLPGMYLLRNLGIHTCLLHRQSCANFQENTICRLCSEPPQSTAIGCANGVGVLWLCLSLMICRPSQHESFQTLAPSQLLYWSEIWAASETFYLFGEIVSFYGCRQWAGGWVMTSQNWEHLFFGRTPEGPRPDL